MFKKQGQVRNGQQQGKVLRVAHGGGGGERGNNYLQDNSVMLLASKVLSETSVVVQIKGCMQVTFRAEKHPRYIYSGWCLK